MSISKFEWSIDWVQLSIIWAFFMLRVVELGNEKASHINHLIP